MNKVFLIGNLTRDPELTETNSVVKVCRFNLAVNRQYTNGDGLHRHELAMPVDIRSEERACGKYVAQNRAGNG